MNSKVEQVIEISNKMVFGTPQKELSEYKRQMEAVMETMTGEELIELFNARSWTQQFKIYYHQKYIDKFKQ